MSRGRNRLAGSGSDFTALRQLVADLGKLEPATRKELRRGMLNAGQGALQDAKARASWSSRIPGAITMGARTSGTSVGVHLRVNAARAPHARPYEGIGGRGGSFRHPVFGDRDVWVSQVRRPFLVPAVQAARADVIREVQDAVNAAARAANFT